MDALRPQHAFAPRARRSPRRAGLTLIELMVAMALMTVLTGTIVFIFTQAQNIFQQVDAKVQVYQYARGAFDQMERDLANVVVTSDMDFYQDLNKNGHYDTGEELNPGVGIDGTEEALLNQPPYSLGLPAIPNHYHYGMTLRSPKYYQGTTDNKYHAHDSIYFKTITQYQGSTSAALVEYALTDMNRERPKLQKRIWRVTGMDATQTPPRVQVNDNPTSTKPVVQDLCLYVTDVQFQFFVKNKRKGDVKAQKFSPGTFYTAEELVSSRIDPVTLAQPFAPFHNYWTGTPSQQIPSELGGQSYMVMCFYDQNHAGASDVGTFDDPQKLGWMRTNNWFDFPMLSPGDKIYVWGGPNGSGVGTGGGTTQLGVPTNDYQIKRFVDSSPNPANPSGQFYVEFNEHISIGSSNFQQSNYAYRAGWVPPAVRVTLRIKDAKAKEIRTISRTFKVLASS